MLLIYILFENILLAEETTEALRMLNETHLRWSNTETDPYGRKVL